MVFKRQRRLNAHDSLGIIGQRGAVLICAVPRINAIIRRINACGQNLEIQIEVINRLSYIFCFLAVVHRSIHAGNGVFQALGIAQQTGINAG